MKALVKGKVVKEYNNQVFGLMRTVSVALCGIGLRRLV
jgi:hypothetical protein